MARKGQSGGVNRSQAIRDVFTQNPQSSAKDVITTLAAKGVKVEPSLVYFIKGKLKRRKRREIGTHMAQAGVANPVQLILQVRTLADAAGGMTKLKQLVDALVG